MDESFKERLTNLPLYRIAIVLLFLLNLSFLLKADVAFNQDLGRHIKSGELIVSSGQVAKTNQFSYTHPDFPFINHHWGFQVLMFGVEKTVGVDLFLVVKISILLITSFLILKLIPQDKEVLILPLGFIFIHVLRERVDLRPEIFSFSFTSLILFILFRYYRKAIFFIPLIQLIWVNTHIYFALGLMIQAIFIAGLAVKKEFRQARILMMIFLASLVATLLNPNFIQGALYPFQIFGNYGYTIVENQNLFFLESIGFDNQNAIWVKVAILVVALSSLFMVARKRFDLMVISLATLGVALALLNVRSFPYLFYLSFPAVLLMLPKLKLSNFWLGLNLVVAGILIFEVLGNFSQAEIHASESGKAGLDFLLDKKLPQPIFNNFDIGSYITYRSYPEYRVFVDGRPEAYPKEFFKGEYIPMQESPELFKEKSGQYGFKTVIFSVTDQTPWGQKFLQDMSKNGEWEMVYLDNFIVIFVRKDSLKSLE